MMSNTTSLSRKSKEKKINTPDQNNIEGEEGHNFKQNKVINKMKIWDIKPLEESLLFSLILKKRKLHPKKQILKSLCKSVNGFKNFL